MRGGEVALWGGVEALIAESVFELVEWCGRHMARV